MTTLDLDTLTLTHGSHSNRDEGVCLLEAVAWYAGEDHSDMPSCVSMVLCTYGTRLNDVLPHGRRQELKPLVPRLVGTASDGLDERRSYMALDWLVRTYTPAWLDLAGLVAEAQALRDLRRIVDMVAAQAAGPVVRAGREKADAAGAAAGAAARAAAWDAAWDVAWDVAGAAARAAAWDAAGAAAGAAARAAAWDAAWDVAWDVAGAAARDVARDAARDVARAAARERLQPTVDQLQTSAIALYAAMIRPVDDWRQVDGG
jgi:hypothetical protein